MQENVTASEDCANGQDITASYELTYTTDSGTLNTTCFVDGTECSDKKCHHELRNNTADSRCQPPVSQFSGAGEGLTVSVTANNIVGRSNSSVSRSISKQLCIFMVYKPDRLFGFHQLFEINQYWECLTFHCMFMHIN